MANVEAVIVGQWDGIVRPGLENHNMRRTRRRSLVTPRDLVNLHITDDAHLLMPKAASLLHDFSADGDIISINYSQTPAGYLIQMSGGKILFMFQPTHPLPDTWPDPPVITHVATMPAGDEEHKLWLNSVGDEGALFGFAPRGWAPAGADGKTWHLHGDGSDPTATDVTATLEPTATHSMMYKGRRIWVKWGRRVYFSELNDHLSARPEDNEFEIGGDGGGATFQSNPEAIEGMISWEDVLVFFLSSGVWTLTGAAPEHWVLRQSMTTIGNVSPWTLSPTEDGVISYGGQNANERAVWKFLGERSVKLSHDIDDFVQESVGEFPFWSTISSGRYILATGREGNWNRQFLVYDTHFDRWTTFDGFDRGIAETTLNSIFTTTGGLLYWDMYTPLPRAPGRSARAILGFHDDEHPTGWARFMGIKISGRRWGTGTPTISLTAKTEKPDSTVTVSDVPIPDNVFDSLLIPLNIRGHGLEIDFQITPANDDNEVLLESLQLVMSRKGEKLARV